MSAHAAATRLHRLATTFHRSGIGGSVVRTAGFNVVSAAAAGLGAIILARTVGPAVRGEYAAITAWFGVAIMVGGMGQPAALCFYVARDPRSARAYVATSRAMMLVSGVIAIGGGMLLAPVLAHGNPGVETGYRIAFGASLVVFVAASYTFSLQARDLRRWNMVRLSQPVLSVIAVVVLWRLRLLTLDAALIVLVVTMLLQLSCAYFTCRRTGLAPGRAERRLIRPLAGYGIAQIAAVTPAALNARLDQLVLSQTVSSADLGRYAIAVSLTLLPIPLVSAIGDVTFPRLASKRTVSGEVWRLQWLAVLASAGLATGLLVPLALVAYWLVPLVFGAGYLGAVPLLWILTPGAVFLACGQVVGDLLQGRKRPLVVARAQGLAAIFTVVLLLALLPVVGVYGAAIASTVAYGVALATMLRSLRLLPSEESGTLRSGSGAGDRQRSERLRLGGFDRISNESCLAEASGASMQVGVVGPVGSEDFAENVGDALCRIGCAVTMLGPAGPHRFRHWLPNGAASLVRQALPRLDEHAQRRIVRMAADAGCDVVINIDARLLPGTVTQLRRGGVRVAFWFPDHVANLGRQLMLLAPYDALFFKEPHVVARVQAALGLPVYYLPEACNPRWHRPLGPAGTEPHLVVAGGMYPYRVRLIERLIGKGIPLKLYGPGFPRWLGETPAHAAHSGRCIYYDEKAKAYRSAAGVLNTMHPAELTGVNGRLFQAAGCGGAVLTEFRPAVTGLFDVGGEVLVYHDFDELVSQATRLLTEVGLTARLGDAATRRAYSDHTYDLRLTTILEKLS